MIKQFPVVPQEAINEFNNQKGNVNHEYLRRNCRAKTTDIENESDDTALIQICPDYNHDYTKIQALMMIVTVTRNTPRHQPQ